jgi:hypothetical protein
LEDTPSPTNTTASASSSIATSVEQAAEHAPQDTTNLFIDPRLLTGAIDFEGLGENEAGEPTAAVEEAYFEEVVSPAAETSLAELRIDGVDFVRHFSKINVSTNQVLAQFGNHAEKAALTASAYTGGSRDPVTLWIFSCKNATFGCLYHNHFYSQVLEHQRTCKIISAEAFAALNEVKAFPCDRDGCDKSFESKGRLNNHVADMRDWEPRACKKPGCDPSFVFQSRREFAKHGERAHSPYTPTCQYPGCTCQIKFASSKTYRAHLGSVHSLNDRKEKDKYMPGKKPTFVPLKCRLPSCTSTQTFAQRSTLRTHLASKHNYTDEEIESYMA